MKRAVLFALVADVCVSVLSACCGPTNGLAYAFYPTFRLTSTDGGNSFEHLSVQSENFAEDIFKVKLPGTDAASLTELSPEKLRETGFFDLDNPAYFVGLNMHVKLKNGKIDYFIFGPGRDHPLAGTHPSAELIYASTGEVIDFPISKEQMEKMFGKKYTTSSR